MIIAPRDENLYTRVICVESQQFIDHLNIALWGDCSIIEGQWYDAIIEGEFYENEIGNSLADRNYILIRFGQGLCAWSRNFFKTDSEIREEKIQSVLNGSNQEHCYYSDLPSPWAYVEKEVAKLKKSLKQIL